MIVRSAREEDAAAIAAVYAPHVLYGSATFEEAPPDPGEMAGRMAKIYAAGLPFLVAELDGRVAGYASAAPHHHRSGYRFTVEDSVYVAPDAQGRGIGRALLAAVTDRCAVAGVRQVLAAIGDSGNAASIALHAAQGFRTIGVMSAVGFKHGRWLDVVWMQRSLEGEGPQNSRFGLKGDRTVR